ncbi:contractile injection system protein, VgrG/Pvc8 family [Acinetobacter sp. VNK23]|uniref:contractile injection system protein, VgrG/Pvc8 family n=1 Tax=Acinetobacter thutiue TaxID=2998078 RepID=UPI0025765E94|nr:contractile injection system protein, VgrG/Pvc8 family [Acinetobacter thutiue]MDM1022080.1 contractile injection system protein, VgrG/Pvc8 family [Acinetobacter thutiue]
MSISTVLSAIKSDLLEASPKAIYRLVVNDMDISSLVNNRLISLNIEDKRGMESDSLSLVLSDHDGLLEIPPLNAEIQVWIGWESTGLVYKGKYKATEVDHAGVPDQLSIRATSADLKKNLKLKKERSFDNKNIAEIITAIANEHELIPYVHPDLADIVLAHIDQNESDANLMTRIADEHSAIATIKNGSLLFMPKGKSETASGVRLPTMMIIRSSGDDHRYSKTNGGDDISGVTCYYYDPGKAERQSVTVGDNTQNIKELRHYYRDQDTAFHAAQAEYNRIKSKAAVFSITLARGMPELIPEMEIDVQGFKQEIDDIIWLGTTIKHSLDAEGGFNTSVEAEVKLPDSDDIAQLIEEEGGGNFTGVVAYYKNGNATPKVTMGDQASPKRLTYLYKNKKTAQNAAKREWDAIQAEQKASQQPSSS